MPELLWPECLVCGGTMSSRICYRCIESEVHRWLSSKNPAYISSLKQASLFMSSYSFEGAECMMCGRNLNVCSKCYCINIHTALRSDRILASAFLDFAADRGLMLASVKGVLNIRGRMQ